MTRGRQAGRPLVCSAIATDPWCSGPTCQPVTLEIAGSNPVGSAINAFSYAPSARPDGAFLVPRHDRGAHVDVWHNQPVKMRPLRAALGIVAVAFALTVLVAFAGPLLLAATGQPADPGPVAAAP